MIKTVRVILKTCWTIEDLRKGSNEFITFDEDDLLFVLDIKYSAETRKYYRDIYFKGHEHCITIYSENREDVFIERFHN